MAEPFKPVTDRNTSFKDTDKSALYAIAQAAVNVELFTIPLYMTSLYSLQGTHQITGQNNFYQGRLWPGMSTTADARTGNEKAFNAIFSVFIAEMLHLQLASNICKAIGLAPTYTSSALQNSNFGWTCYGADNTVIPHILDLKDTKSYSDIKVTLGPVNKNQVELFLAIEESEDLAEDEITDKSKYFPEVPFAGWKITDTEDDLPLFGSIGFMYLSLFKYLNITYTDNTTLWDYVFQSKSLQQDVFNSTDNHTPEYPEMSATVTATNADQALMQVIDMIQGITDQGEGKGVLPDLKKAAVRLLKNPLKSSLLTNEVKKNFRPDAEALEKDYPSYNDKGEQQPKSRDAAARMKYGQIDHYETFAEVKKLLEAKELLTWEEWHAAGNKWSADLLQTKDYAQNHYPIPPAEDIAGALNRLKETDTEANFKMFSQVVAGAIKGVTTVLNDYWNGKAKSFPFPSMAGSGDRMSICWAIFGRTPDLSLGVPAKTAGILYHACQGLNLDANNPGDPNNCAALQVYHTCKGSNTCAAEGGCGFVQSVAGGGSCGGSGSSCGQSGKPQDINSKKKMVAMTHTGNPTLHASAGAGCGAPSQSSSGCGAPSSGSSGCGAPKHDKVLCGGSTPTGPVYYSAPSDNRCASYGGCAVPISASQMFPNPPVPTDPKNPTEGRMEVFNFNGTQFQPTSINTMAYQAGELVYDVAWNAYIAVLQERQRPIPAKPKPSDLRLAFPPST